MRRKRPNWEDRDFLGQEVGAFADFLLWGMQDTPLLRNRAVAVYDAHTGTCEIFRPLRAAGSTSPVLALWFSGAHYRWVRWSTPEPSLPELLTSHHLPGATRPRVTTVITNAEE